MKKVFWMLSSLALVGFGFVACDDEDTDKCNNSCKDNELCSYVKKVDGNKAYQCLSGVDALCIDSITGKFKEGKIIELEANGDQNCVTNSETHTNQCEGDGNCDSTQKCDLTVTPHVCVPRENAPKVYKYVRIKDESSKNTGHDPGADIDTVLIMNSAGEQKGKPKAVVDYKPNFNDAGDDKSNKDKLKTIKYYAADPDKALVLDSLDQYGTKDASCKYYRDNTKGIGTKACDPSKDNNDWCGKGGDLSACDSICDYDYTFVSIGAGGTLTLEMDAAIEAGDRIDVIEVGDCALKNTASGGAAGGGSALVEAMTVSIAIQAENADSWRVVGGANNKKEAQKGLASFIVSASDVAAAE